MISRLLNGCLFLVLLLIGSSVAYHSYLGSQDSQRSTSPDGQTQVAIRIDSPNDERDGVKVLLYKGGGDAITIARASQIEGPGVEEIYWTSDSKHFMVVGQASVPHPDEFKLSDGRWIYLVYDLKEDKNWLGLATNTEQVTLRGEHWQGLDWPPALQSLLGASPSPTPAASAEATPTPEQPETSPTP